MKTDEKPLAWLHGEIKTPPFSMKARLEADYLLRCLQLGHKLAMPHSRPMPSVGKACHELRINDTTITWRIIYKIDTDAILILEVFEKKTNKTPREVIETCRRRMKIYESINKVTAHEKS